MNFPRHPSSFSFPGVRQYYTLVKEVDSNSMPHEVFVAKSRLLANVLQAFPFRQCMVFSNYRDRAEQLAEALSDQGWACAYISGPCQRVAPNQFRDFLLWLVHDATLWSIKGGPLVQAPRLKESASVPWPSCTPSSSVSSYPQTWYATRSSALDTLLAGDAVISYGHGLLAVESV